jgi:hypothetical protein
VFSIYRDGRRNGRQRWRCKGCGHVWLQAGGRPDWIAHAYRDYAYGRQTLAELSRRYGCHRETLRRRFERYAAAVTPREVPSAPAALTFDATFFGRDYGLLVYRALGRNIHWQEVDHEKMEYIAQGLRALHAQGWRFSSFTIDGRRGVIQLLEELFPAVPIQFCLYHQKALVQRYLIGHLKTDCAKAIRSLMADMLRISELEFLTRLHAIKRQYRDMLTERNASGQFKYPTLRAALRSLTANSLYLYTWKRFPNLQIPNTTNSCDGSFAHWKAKVKLHRGLRKDRRAKMIHFLLQYP